MIEGATFEVLPNASKLRTRLESNKIATYTSITDYKRVEETYQVTVSEETLRDDRIYKQMKLGVVGDQKFGRFSQSRRHGIAGFTQLRKNQFASFTRPVCFALNDRQRVNAKNLV